MNLKDVLSKTQIGRKDKVLIVLDAEEQSVKTVSQTRDILVKNGVRSAKDWNLSQILGNTQGLAVRVETGWEITQQGRQHLAELKIGNILPTQSKLSLLRAEVSKIQDDKIKAFVAEAISALEHQLYRAAVVFSWVGAVALLYEHVLQNCLTPFNQEATRRDSKWKAAKTTDDLALMTEFAFLQILSNISVIGKNVKQELEQCLQLRNACGHPNSLSFGEHRVASHLEILTLNVYSKFKA
jgi:hypothetical protein